jgi:hypothetical protein
MTDEEPPPKNPEKYAENVLKKAKVSNGLVNTFFKDNVQRARDRNGRYVIDCDHKTFVADSKAVPWNLSRSLRILT